MRTVLIGAVGGTEIVLRAMNECGHPPALLATFEPGLGRRRHGDYVDLAPLAAPETEVAFVDNVNDRDFLDRIAAIAPDVILVIGWSQLVGAELRALARRYCVGFHPSLLPQMRGRAVLGWTILSGVRETGSTLFVIDEGTDTGDLLAQARVPLGPRETVATLGVKVVDALHGMIVDLLPRLADESARAVPQPEAGASYCAKRTPEDSLIDWREPADAIDRLIRASTRPYAGAFTFTRKRRVTIWAAEPVDLDAPYHAGVGQVVFHDDGRPVVRCGDGRYLRVDDHETADGKPLTGQIRFRDGLDLH